MVPEWREFLRDAGAEFDDGTVADFGNPERERRVAVTGNVFCDLSHYGLIAARGEDAGAFLHAQLTNDVAGLGPGDSRLAAYCDPKGRMLAVLRLFRCGDEFRLRLPGTLTETVVERLRRFVLRSRVGLDVDADLARLGVSGPRAGELVATAAGAAPAGTGRVVQGREATIVGVPGVLPRFEIYAPPAAMRAIWDSLNVHAAPVGAAVWRLLEIQAGLPVVYPETAGRFVPQMANLHRVDGVSFRKGCYPGQEVVARMQYLGKLKRHMILAHAAATREPRPGDPLFAPDTGAGTDVGAVVDAAPAPDGGYLLLAVVQIASAAGEVRLWDAAGPPLLARPLPYPLEEEDPGPAAP